MTSTDPLHEPDVSRRAVFFIPGFDPFGPRRYRELYRKQAQVQAEASGFSIEVAGRPRGDDYGWTVRTEIDGKSTEAEVTVLQWNDLVRGAMGRTVWDSYGEMLRTVHLYLRSGAFLALWRLRPIPMLIALYPPILMILYVVIAGLLAAWIGEEIGGISGWIVGLALFVGLVWFSRRRDRWLKAYYLMSDYAYTAQDRGATPAELKERLDRFAERVEAALAGDVDEVLLVGHSTGAQLAVQTVARVAAVDNRSAALGLLTLGQVIPMVSFLPGARDLRRDLHNVAARRDVFWLDVSTPADGACFALSDPVAVTGVAPEEGAKQGPKVVSPAYGRTLSPRQVAALRWRFFIKHIQYLRAFERAELYDYFRITGGPQTLRGRFGSRGSTASRIERVLSPHRDL